MTEVSKEQSTTGCNCKKEKPRIAKAIAEWQKQRQAVDGETPLEACGSVSVVASLPPPPMDRYDCMDEWYMCYMFASYIDTYTADVVAINERIGLAEAELITALQNYTDCMLGIPV